MINKFFPQLSSARLGFLSLIIPALIFLGILAMLFLPIPFSPILWMSSKLGLTILAALGISLGIFGLKKSTQSKPSFTPRILCVMGTLFGVTVGYGLWNVPPKVTGVITAIRVYEQHESSKFIRSLQIRPDEPVPGFALHSGFYPAPLFIANTTWDTLVVRQTIGPLTTIVNQNQLEVNQHIEIEFDGSVFVTAPAQVDAIVIRILGR